MNVKLTVTLVLPVLIAGTGCRAISGAGASDRVAPAADVSTSASSLLYQVLSDERHLGKLLIIKREGREANRLIKEIAEKSGEGADQIERFAGKNGRPVLKSTGLPPGELAVREAVATTKKKQLIHSHGDEFERFLLLTQLEALSYASHLARVIARNNPHPAQVAYFDNLHQELHALYSRVFQLLFKTSDANSLDEALNSGASRTLARMDVRDPHCLKRAS